MCQNQRRDEHSHLFVIYCKGFQEPPQLSRELEIAPNNQYDPSQSDLGHPTMEMLLPTTSINTSACMSTKITKSFIQLLIFTSSLLLILPHESLSFSLTNTLPIQRATISHSIRKPQSSSSSSLSSCEYYHHLNQCYNNQSLLRHNYHRHHHRLHQTTHDDNDRTHEPVQTKDSETRTNNNDNINDDNETENLGRRELQKFFAFPLDSWQAKAGGEILLGRNVINCAPTGAGKTVVCACL